MLQTTDLINRETFSSEVKLIVLRGTSYLDAIMTVKSRHELNEADIPRLIDSEIQSQLEQEMIRLKMINRKDEEE